MQEKKDERVKIAGRGVFVPLVLNRQPDLKVQVSKPQLELKASTANSPTVVDLFSSQTETLVPGSLVKQTDFFLAKTVQLRTALSAYRVSFCDKVEGSKEASASRP